MAVSIRYACIAMIGMAVIASASCNTHTSTNTGNSNDTTVKAKLKDAASDLGAAANKAANDVKDAADKATNNVKSALKVNNDSNFTVYAYVSNNKTLQMAQAAINNGSSRELKNIAHKIQADRKKTDEQVSAYASKNNIVLPANKGDAGSELSDINNKSGFSWDKSWLNHMAGCYEDEINRYESARDNVKDPELKNIILNTLPVLRSDYDQVKNLQDRMSSK